jgi:hypothetical protein
MAASGVVVYDIGTQGTLQGRWTHPDLHGALGTEVATGGTPFEITGRYQVEIFGPTGIKLYEGTLTIRQVADALSLEWSGERLLPHRVRATYSGVGVTTNKGQLAACFQ